MKNYNKPECEFVILSVEDTITASESGFGDVAEWDKFIGFGDTAGWISSSGQ